MGDKISLILPDDLKEEIDKLKEIHKEEQSSYIRKLLWKSVIQEKRDYAISQYLDDEISLGKSSEIAGICIREMLNELQERNITLKYKISEAELEIEKILKKYKKVDYPSSFLGFFIPSKFHFAENKVSYFFMMSLSFVKTLNQTKIRRLLQNRILNKSAILEVWLQLDQDIG